MFRAVATRVSAAAAVRPAMTRSMATQRVRTQRKSTQREQAAESSYSSAATAETAMLARFSRRLEQNPACSTHSPMLHM